MGLQIKRIINYILSELNIDLEYTLLVAAMTLIDDGNLYYNARASFVPAKTLHPMVQPSDKQLHAYGVGDIRVYDPGMSDI